MDRKTGPWSQWHCKASEANSVLLEAEKCRIVQTGKISFLDLREEEFLSLQSAWCHWRRHKICLSPPRSLALEKVCVWEGKLSRRHHWVERVDSTSVWRRATWVVESLKVLLFCNENRRFFDWLDRLTRKCAYLLTVFWAWVQIWPNNRKDSRRSLENWPLYTTFWEI